MADITKCNGIDCPLKESCYRFTSIESKYQSYFMQTPLKDGECDMYLVKQNEYTMKQIKDIING